MIHCQIMCSASAERPSILLDLEGKFMKTWAKEKNLVSWYPHTNKNHTVWFICGILGVTITNFPVSREEAGGECLKVVISYHPCQPKNSVYLHIIRTLHFPFPTNASTCTLKHCSHWFTCDEDLRQWFVISPARYSTFLAR